MTTRERELRIERALYLGMVKGARIILTLKGTQERGKQIRQWDLKVKELDGELGHIEIEKELRGK
jgi:hypothetical protein